MGEYRIIHDEKNENDAIKQLFVRRDFQGIRDYFKNSGGVFNDSNSAMSVKALIYHILGEHDEAARLYELIRDKKIGQVNFLAHCHRYFAYDQLDNNEGCHNTIYLNNYINYLLGTNQMIDVDLEQKKLSIFGERIINDIYAKKGLPLLYENNDILKRQYLDDVVIIEEKNINNSRKKVGVFVTDIQRHKDAAIIFELVEILKNHFDIYIYFNNIFANKLAKTFEKDSTVRYTINLYYEEVNNLIYEDEIDILIDLAGVGLRNNNISLALIQNIVDIYDMLDQFPVLLKTASYFPYYEKNGKQDGDCVLGDLRCVSNDELIEIRQTIHGKVVFESHSLDDSLFRKNFYRRLEELGFDMSGVELQKGVLPFSEYMKYISSYKNLILTSGTTYAEMCEAIFSESNIIVLSKNRRIESLVAMYSKEMEMSLRKRLIEKEYAANAENLVDYILSQNCNRMVKIVNKKSRIAYFEEVKEVCISNTCNGDIIILDEGQE